jgi:hypothetical protein
MYRCPEELGLRPLQPIVFKSGSVFYDLKPRLNEAFVFRYWIQHDLAELLLQPEMHQSGRGFLNSAPSSDADAR